MDLTAFIGPTVLGFGTGLALIVAIGSQNAFVLRQGIRGEHVAAVVLVCSVSDARCSSLRASPEWGRCSSRVP
ncbi:arginine exporter protein ArgO [Arthrobacter sp. UYNi723]